MRRRYTGQIDDGTLFGDARGGQVRVFKPRWWQVWRWAEWFRSRERAHVEVEQGEYDADLDEVVLRRRRHRVLPASPGKRP